MRTRGCDSRFVARCYNRIQDIRNSGRTILFVSHNLGEVARMTDRVVVLDGGRTVFDGSSTEGIAVYEERSLGAGCGAAREKLSGVSVALDILDMDGGPLASVAIGSAVKLRLRVDSESDLGPQFLYVRLVDTRDDQLVAYLMQDRILVGKALFADADYNVRLARGRTEIVWTVPHWGVGEGDYLFDVYLGPPVDSRHPDLSGGRTWRKVQVTSAVYENPYLKGSAARLEVPVQDVRITHEQSAADAD